MNFEPAHLAHREGQAPNTAQTDTPTLLASCLAGREPGPTDRERATSLLRQAGGLRPLFAGHLRKPIPLPADWAPRLEAMVELMQRCRQESPERGKALTSPADTLEYLGDALRDRRHEVFFALFLDTRHRVLHAEELFQGSIDGACVYPRVVAEKALRCGAAALIVAHNHPSGVTEPSLADQAITRRLKESLALLEIRLLDHFIVGDGVPVSLASRGLL